MRRRITPSTEEHIWALRCQGLRLEAIAFSTGFAASSIHRALRRARRRRLPADNPLRLGSWAAGQPRLSALAWPLRPAPAPRPYRAAPFANRLLLP